MMLPVDRTQQHHLKGGLPMQQKLSALYESHLAHARSHLQIAPKLSCPLLLSVVPGWESAKHRLLVIGQETFGWDLMEQEGNGHTNSIANLQQLIDSGPFRTSVDALTRKYCEFFSGTGWENRPFWNAIGGLRTRLGRDAVLWSNVFRFDFEGRSTLKASKQELEEVFEIQDGMLRNEIEILKPTAVVFFSGPNYDFALAREFGGIETQQVADFPQRGFARLVAKGLPPDSYRIYHPAYLWRSKKREWLAHLERILSTGP
jgi:hypothetical protein